MSVQQKSNAVNRANTIRRRNNVEFFAITRASMAKPRNLSEYGRVVLSTVDQDNVTVYGFETEGDRDRFVKEQRGVSVLPLA